MPERRADPEPAVPTVTAVVVAYRAEPLLRDAVAAILASRRVEVNVIVVDNGCTDAGVSSLRDTPGVEIVVPGRNLGFAEGCNVGAARATGDHLALVNPDAIVGPDALAHLAATASDARIGIVSASLRLADDPDTMNSAGNAVHFLGFSWCGALGRPASEHAVRRDVASASGAAMLLRRTTWETLGGFAPEYFTYYEDAELSLRCWQRGLRVVFEPAAVVTHRYEFARHDRKMYLVERNRLIAALTLYESTTLALLAPALVAVEVAMLGAAVVQGWGRAKLAGWWWLLTHGTWVRRRRRALQRGRSVPDAAIAPLLATRLGDGNQPIPALLRCLDALLARYWRGVRASIARRDSGQGPTFDATTMSSL